MPEMGEGLGWVLIVNLVLWTGLFLYMMRLQGRLRAAERRAAERDAESSGDRGPGSLDRSP